MTSCFWCKAAFDDMGYCLKLSYDELLSEQSCFRCKVFDYIIVTVVFIF